MIASLNAENLNRILLIVGVVAAIGAAGARWAGYHDIDVTLMALATSAGFSSGWLQPRPAKGEVVERP